MAATLVGKPEWEALWRIMDEAQAIHWNSLARKFATADERPDYEQLQYWRGYFACAQRLRRVAPEALRHVEKNTPKEVPE